MDWVRNYEVDDPAWHTARAAEKGHQIRLFHDLFGDPCRPFSIDPAGLTWHDRLVVRLAQAAYEERNLPAGTLDNDGLAVLADALEEAGCQDGQLLGHLRSGGEHYRGCWAVDALLGRPERCTEAAEFLPGVEGRADRGGREAVPESTRPNSLGYGSTRGGPSSTGAYRTGSSGTRPRSARRRIETTPA